MKIRLRRAGTPALLIASQSSQGSALAVTLIICGILGLLMASYLHMVKTQNLSVARAQAWNSALVMAEAGVEDALGHLNSGIKTNNLAVNSWVTAPGGAIKS